MPTNIPQLLEATNTTPPKKKEEEKDSYAT